MSATKNSKFQCSKLINNSSRKSLLQPIYYGSIFFSIPRNFDAICISEYELLLFYGTYFFSLNQYFFFQSSESVEEVLVFEFGLKSSLLLLSDPLKRFELLEICLLKIEPDGWADFEGSTPIKSSLFSDTIIWTCSATIGVEQIKWKYF